MKALFLAAVSISLCQALHGQKPEGGGSAKLELKGAEEAPAKEEKETPAEMLKTAMENMARLTSYHVDSQVLSGAKPTLVGDLGPGTVSLRGDDKKGNIRQRRLVDEKPYISHDDGKTWAEDPDKDTTALLSNMLTGPVSPKLRIWEKNTFTVSEVEVKGEKLILLDSPAEGERAETKYWLVHDEKLDALFVRRVVVTIDATDAEFPISITYTKFNEPVDIKAPE